MTLVANSIGAVVIGEFMNEAKAETIGRLLGIRVTSEATVPISKTGSDTSGTIYACIIRAVDATPEAKPRNKVTDLNMTLYLCHRGNLSRFCIVPRNHLRLCKK